VSLLVPRVVAGAAVAVTIASLLLLLLRSPLRGHRRYFCWRHRCWCCCHHCITATSAATASAAVTLTIMSLLVLTSPSHCFWGHYCSHCHIATAAALAII
jgi:hypothetical protein